MEHLFERIKKIEALIAGTSTVGEKNAALSAKQRILKKLPGLEVHANPQEYSLYTNSEWKKKLLLAICRKYGVNQENLQNYRLILSFL